MTKVFDIYKEVPNLNLCKRLKELGYPQDTGGWYWIKEEIRDVFSGETINQEWILKFESKRPDLLPWYRNVLFIKAPTVRELGEIIPYYHPYLGVLLTEKDEERCLFCCFYDNLSVGKIYALAESEANARAMILIRLIKNGYVKFDDKTFPEGDVIK